MTVQDVTQILAGFTAGAVLVGIAHLIAMSKVKENVKRLKGVLGDVERQVTPRIPWAEFVRSAAHGSRNTVSTTNSILVYLVDRPWVARRIAGYPPRHWVLAPGAIPDTHPVYADELSRDPKEGQGHNGREA